MLKKLLLILSLLGTAVGAKASDSQWLLCDDGDLVLNVFNHRAGAKDRNIDITLIFGQYQLVGILGTEEVTLQGKTGKFKGRIVLTDHSRSVTVNGLLYLDGGSNPVNALLTCKTMGRKL